MLHPLFSTAITRPDLVLEHVSAYAGLFNAEAKAAGSQLLLRSAAWVMAALFGVVFLGLTGTALMLGLLQNQFHWVLVLVPAAALLMTLLARLRARQPLSTDHFSQLKNQVDGDLAALRLTA